MRSRRFLLVTTALSSAALVSACKKEPVPGNPKGSAYDNGEALPLPGNPKGSHYDQPAPDAGAQALARDGAEKDAGAVKDAAADARPILRLPANPKGSHYDRPKPPPKSSR